ncbi:MAG: phosphoglycerate dehydrogenase [Epsilonproteobacteria bacterium]|nr:phosphoglycerate dehydrogenase [Campylobacterota bacterium]
MKIAVTSPSFSKNKRLREETLKYFEDVKFNLEGKRFKKDELIEYLKEADGAIIGLEPIDREVLEACSNLKYISKYGVGLNNIDLDECRKRGVKIGWRGGVNRLSVAEMALGFMLMLSRNLYITSNLLKEGTWQKEGGFELSGKTIGIIGVGFIGKELIRLLEPFNCKILVNDIVDQESYYRVHGLIEATKEDIYREADIISIHTPFDETTKDLITLREFKMMKPTAFLLNTARGGIVNEADLKYALKNSLIAGAGIDAYVVEPPIDRELIELPNLIATPHIGGNSKEAVLAMGLNAIENLKLIMESRE